MGDRFGPKMLIDRKMSSPDEDEADVCPGDGRKRRTPAGLSICTADCSYSKESTISSPDVKVVGYVCGRVLFGKVFDHKTLKPCCTGSTTRWP